MSDRFLSRELEEAGAKHRVLAIPDPLTLEYMQAQCSQLERIYRLQLQGDDKLDFRDENELAGTQPPDTMFRAMRRWAFLKHLYYRRSEGLVRASSEVTDVEAEEAARKLLIREPELIYLGNGVTASVTSRSYNAMYLIADHWQAIRLLDLTLGDIEELMRKLEAGNHPSRRRRLGKLTGMYGRVIAELSLQRRWLYAHALSEDGAPAQDTDHLPDWWQTIDPGMDVRLLMGLYQVGRGRHATMTARDKERAEQNPTVENEESLGWASLFASIEDRRRLPRGSMYDADLWQELAGIRAAKRPDMGGLDG